MKVTGTLKEEKPISDMDFILTLANNFDAVILYEPLFYRRLHNTNYSSVNWAKRHKQGVDLIRSYKASLPAKLFADSLFKCYINFGEQYLTNNECQRAITQFFNAWRNKPFSIVPLKKMAKAVLHTFKK